MAKKSEYQLAQWIADKMNAAIPFEEPIDKSLKKDLLQKSLIQAFVEVANPEIDTLTDDVLDWFEDAGCNISAWRETSDEVKLTSEEEERLEEASEIAVEEANEQIAAAKAEEELVEEDKERKQKIKKQKSKTKKASKEKAKKEESDVEPPSKEIHPLCLLMPEMEQYQFDEFLEDIEENGLKNPIILFEGQIVDGRSRYMACVELGVEPRYVEYSGTEETLLQDIISWNIKRRHLTPAQRAALGVELLPNFEKIGKEKQKQAGKSKKKQKESFRATEEAAKVVGSTSKAISTAKKVKKESPEDFKKMKQGKKNIEQAKKKVSKTKKEFDQTSEWGMVLSQQSKKYLKLVFDALGAFEISSEEPAYLSDLLNVRDSVEILISKL